MTYASLMADADLYLSLNNTMNYVAPTATVVSTTGTLAPVFLEDAPANTGSTHSLRLNGYGTGVGAMIHDTFTNLNNSGTGRSITFWYKFSKQDGSPFTYGENTGTLINIAKNGTGGPEGLNIGHGILTTSRTTSASKPAYSSSVINTSTSAVTSISYATGGMLIMDSAKWNHIAITEFAYQNTVYGAVYVNGVCVRYTSTSSRNLRWDGFGTNNEPFEALISSFGADVGLKKIAHFAVWNRALGREEIRQQAFYGNQTNTSYKNTVMEKNPVYFNTLDNALVTETPEILGTNASSWGNFEDAFNCITVNQPGLQETKGWRHKYGNLSGDNVATTTTLAFRQGMSNLIKSGQCTIEFWLKIDPYYSSTTSPAILAFGETTNLSNGIMHITHSSGFGRLGAITSRKSGDTTYAQQTLSGNQIVNSINSGPAQIGPGTYVDNNGTQAGGGWADGNWHQAVFRITTTTGYNSGYTAQFLVDGYEIANTSMATTWGWIDGTGDISTITIGSPSVPAVLFGMAIDNIAIYDKFLSDSEIQDNFTSALYYVEPQASGYDVKYYDGTNWQQSLSQKYYDGTTWVDWNNVSEPKRWDGTSWVNLT